MKIPEKDIKAVKETIKVMITNNRLFEKVKKDYEIEKKELTDKIIGFMDKYSFNDGLKFTEKNFNDIKHYACKKVTPTKLIWNTDELKSKLTKEQQEKILEKTITINDWNAVVKLLKKHGVNPKEFIKLLNVETKVNEAALNQMGELGEIDLDSLKGCYEIKKASSYLRVSIKEDVKDDKGEQEI